MNTTSDERLNLEGEEAAVVTELLESEQARLLVEIRHSHHRAFRELLRDRLTIIENLLARCRQS